jgi:hypothetical protein
MLVLPAAAEPLIVSLSIAFTEPTFKRVVPLIVAAILTRGRHTVTGMLRTVGLLASGHWSDYHRVFSRASWSLWPLGHVLARAILACTDPEAPVLLAVDDTTAGHRGAKVYGKGCHHDAVRSSHSHVVWRWGHKWVVLAVSVKFPFTTRRWALPVLVALYRPPKLDEAEGRRHKTPLHLARQLTATMIHWFPDRRFILVGDGGYASHELASFCRRHRRQMTLISRFHADATLYDPPPARRAGQKGRPRVKGPKRLSPAQVVARSPRHRATVRWYGGLDRRIEFVSGTACWYRVGAGLVPLRWVFVHDRQGTHRDEYFYATDPTLTAVEIISAYTARWAIETTFQELRAQVGLETTRQRTQRSVLRAGPCLFGLVSLVSLIYARHLRTHPARPACSAWYVKAEPTFADAMATVRRLFWQQTVFQHGRSNRAFEKVPRGLRELLLDALSRAA